MNVVAGLMLLVVPLVAGAIVLPNCSQEIANLKSTTLPLGAISFDKIDPKGFPKAIFEGLRESKARVEVIKKNAEAPTFANTIEALEAVSEPMDQPVTLFHHYKSLLNSDTIERYSKRIDPILSRFNSGLFTDEVLFKRVEAVYNARESLKLDTEQKTLLDHTYRAFVKSGAKLSPDQKKRIVDIGSELSSLTEVYKKNVNDSTNGYLLHITDVKELAGLPESALGAAEAQAKRRGLEGYAFTLQAPSVMPMLTYADNRERRKEVWAAYSSRALGGKHDNSGTLLKIAQLRAEKAKLLGFASHADLVMSDRMAKKASNVETFLEDLATTYRPHAEKDIAEVQAIAPHPLEAWDFAYYSEKLREKKYNYKSEDLRPYFPLKQVLKGAFYAASKLYGVQFKPRTDLPVWDPTVTAFEVLDAKGQHLAVFYLDPFPREPKRQGAWMTDVKGPGIFGGQLRRPHVINAGNLTPPVGNADALLTMDDVTTVFHELGHGLHSMLTQVRTASLAGTNVAWDFVELPSQFFENFAFEAEVLDVYARHKDTGERIPNELIERVIKAKHFQAGYRGLRQVLLSRLDLAWHSQDLTGVEASQVEAWEEKVTAPYRVFPRPKGTSISTTFSHIFAGGYSGGYYSYKWAEVLAADAFEVFEKNGVFDPATANRFRTTVLERGGSIEADELYRLFRGQAPDPKALLRSEGLGTR